MVEVLFGESEAGAMKASKREGADRVICLGFMLDIGDIKEKADSEYRKNLIYSMYAQEQWAKNEDVNTELKQAGEAYCNELGRLTNYLAQGEPVRIWYSDVPYSMCGFYYLCTVLRKYENEVRVVKLPHHKIRLNAIVSYQHWGEVASEEFADFLICEKTLSREEISMYSIRWNELREDNSPLRAVVNGKVLGVPEDFYDFLIWRNLTEEPVKQARLIGDILGGNQIGISDLWYAKRIDFFIEQGEIAIVEDSENKYARTIKRTRRTVNPDC